MIYETRTYKFEPHELNSETLRKRRFEQIIEELKDETVVECTPLKSIGDWNNTYLKIVTAKTDYGSCQLLDNFNQIIKEGYLDENGRMHWNSVAASSSADGVCLSGRTHMASTRQMKDRKLYRPRRATLKLRVSSNVPIALFLPFYVEIADQGEMI